MDTLNRHGAGAARGAHNSEVTGSKPVAGIITLRPFTEAALVYTLDTTLNPLSSEAERKTHNLEVGGSKPPGGNP